MRNIKGQDHNQSNLEKEKIIKNKHLEFSRYEKSI